MKRSVVWFMLALLAAAWLVEGCGAGGATLLPKDEGPVTIRSTPGPPVGGGGPPPPP